MVNRKIKILHLDDDSGIGASLQHEFTNHGYESFHLQSKVAGLDWIRNNHPDIIISEVRSFDIDGFEFLQILKSDPLTSGIPFIFLTGCATLKFAMEAMKLGADDFVIKPLDWKDLREVVQRVLYERSGPELHEGTRGMLPIY